MSPIDSWRTAQRWLVVGANGMLGHDLMEVLGDAGRDVVGLDLPAVDITDPGSVAGALASVQPGVVVNAAAYTAVDVAEQNEALAMRVNGDGPRVLTKAIAASPGIQLVHISTDYVFSGDASAPYSENAPPAPRSAYGRTKLAGERAVRANLPDRGFVVRTAWLYGEHGPNFVRTMLALEATQPEVAVVDDQRGQPTWARDLAEQIVRLVESGVPAGIFHGTASGETTWCGFAREIFRLVGADPQRVVPTTTAGFLRQAPRPAYSVLGHDRWLDVGIAPIRDWREALGVALPRLAAATA